MLKSHFGTSLKKTFSVKSYRITRALIFLHSCDFYPECCRDGCLLRRLLSDSRFFITVGFFHFCRILVKLLEFSTDPVILAVACHDLGEFVRLYPRGKP